LQPRDIFGNVVVLKKKRISRKEEVKKPVEEPLIPNDDPIDPEILHLMKLSRIKVFRNPKLDEEFFSRIISKIPNWNEIRPQVEAHLIAMPNFSVNQAIDKITGRGVFKRG